MRSRLFLGLFFSCVCSLKILCWSKRSNFPNLRPTNARAISGTRGCLVIALQITDSAFCLYYFKQSHASEPNSFGSHCHAFSILMFHFSWLRDSYNFTKQNKRYHMKSCHLLRKYRFSLFRETKTHSHLLFWMNHERTRMAMSVVFVLGMIDRYGSKEADHGAHSRNFEEKTNVLNMCGIASGWVQWMCFLLRLLHIALIHKCSECSRSLFGHCRPKIYKANGKDVQYGYGMKRVGGRIGFFHPVHIPFYCPVHWA